MTFKLKYQFDLLCSVLYHVIIIFLFRINMKYVVIVPRWHDPKVTNKRLRHSTEDSDSYKHFHMSDEMSDDVLHLVE